MDRDAAVREFKHLEKGRRAKSLSDEDKRRHTELVRALGIRYVCEGTQQGCDPLDPPRGCNCVPEGY